MHVPLRITYASTFLRRLIGLIGRRHLRAGDALLISRCARVHTFFMRMAIDVAMLDSGNRVLRIIESLPPWRIAPSVPGAVACLELAAGAARAFSITPGLKLQCEQAGDGQVLGRMV